MYAFFKKIFKQKYINTNIFTKKILIQLIYTNTYKIGKILPE